MFAVRVRTDVRMKSGANSAPDFGGAGCAGHAKQQFPCSGK